MASPTLKPFYSKIVPDVLANATEAVLGLRGFRNTALRTHLREAIGSPAGTGESMLAEPVFEATFGWKRAEVSMQQIADSGLLCQRLVDALAHPPEQFQPEYIFPPKPYKPYAHQLLAWQALAKPGQSLLVTSGTGSGKTECFLVPILDTLAREIASDVQPGVRAIMLYPLNALIQSQKERLTAWAEGFGGQVGFCLYNGKTPPTAKVNTEHAKCEVQDRKTLREKPPSILVTNSTMLEYMLVRAEDRSILNKSKGALRYIVIDEAHSYIGSQSAELTMLLRRVLDAFGMQPGEVQFIATSATIGDDSIESKQALQKFLANIAGVDVDKVTVVSGAREVPVLPATLEQRRETLPSFEALLNMDQQARFNAFASNPQARELRAALIAKPHQLAPLANSMALSSLETLQCLDLATQTKDANGNAFLSLRGHLFERTVSGLYACVNPACAGRSAALKAELPSVKEAWGFGAVYFDACDECRYCKYPVFELVQCNDCGNELMTAVESNNTLKRWQNDVLEDEFRQALDREQDQLSENEETQEQDQVARRLLAAPNFEGDFERLRLLEGGKLKFKGVEGIEIALCNETQCPYCCSAGKGSFPQFRPVRIGAPFLLKSALPTLLAAMPSMDKGESKIYQGRRLLSFTDSRQGTARIAADLQGDAERQWMRSWIYHRCAPSSVDSVEIAKLEQDIADYCAAEGAFPVFKDKREASERELQTLKAINPIPWRDLKNQLCNDNQFARISSFYSSSRDVELNINEVAEIFLLRELYVRPKRAYSLEGMGLAQLQYPNLVSKGAPACIQRLGGNDQDWQELLRIALDFFVRSRRAVKIDKNLYYRWLKYPGPVTFLLAPGREASKYNMAWPSENPSNQTPLVRLITAVFKLEGRKDALKEILAELWRELQPIFFASDAGFQLNLDKVAVSRVGRVWLCPVTRRLLPTTLRGVTPYLAIGWSEEQAKCEQFMMPTLLDPFWNDSSEADKANWLNNDAAVQSLRERGLWTDLSHRIASKSEYFKSVEHSAQIAPNQLDRRQEQFKEGKINILNCSTTMEMGVDIGGLTAVAMNNVPPHPANFLQRAGRAGRRGETAALSFTLCKAGPHGGAVFKNSLWPFVTKLTLPKVALNSVRIIERHINARCLTEFLGLYRLNKVGDFFEASDAAEASLVKKFVDFLGNPETLSELSSVLTNLASGTALHEKAPVELLARCKASIEKCNDNWLLQLDALLKQQQDIKSKSGDSPAENAIGYQLQRYRGEYLLGELAALGFLPGYGFPTDVVSLDTRTIEEIKRNEKRQQRIKSNNEEPSDRRAMTRNGFPSRQRAQALRDYAPGMDVVIDGRVYSSGGVTLNWQRPVDANAANELQSFQWFWHCQCGKAGVQQTKPMQCCEVKEFNSYQFLEPAGFAVNIRPEPHDDVSQVTYLSPREPIVVFDSAFQPSIELIEFQDRSSANAQVFHYQNGEEKSGYAICLVCGASEDITKAANGKFLKEHKRLRGGKDGDKENQCPGNDSPWAIKQPLWLGAYLRTDAFELQLPINSPNAEIVAWTLAVALRTAVSAELGIEPREINFTAQTQNGYWSAVVFDQASGGAGYSSQALTLLPKLIERVQGLLACPARCEKACQHCLLDYQTQYRIKYLDRTITPFSPQALDF